MDVLSERLVTFLKRLETFKMIGNILKGFETFFLNWNIFKVGNIFKIVRNVLKTDGNVFLNVSNLFKSFPIFLNCFQIFGIVSYLFKNVSNLPLSNCFFRIHFLLVRSSQARQLPDRPNLYYTNTPHQCFQFFVNVDVKCIA